MSIGGYYFNRDRSRECGNETAHVQFQLQGLGTGDGQEGKSGRARVIYLHTDRALEIVSRLSAKYPSGPLLRNNLGRPWNTDAIRQRLRTLNKKASTHLRLYDFRHGYVTRALAAGIDSHNVAQLVGHVSTQMLDKVYSHIAQDHEYMLTQARKMEQKK